jgi:hypothetical protein
MRTTATWLPSLSTTVSIGSGVFFRLHAVDADGDVLHHVVRPRLDPVEVGAVDAVVPASAVAWRQVLSPKTRVDPGPRLMAGGRPLRRTWLDARPGRCRAGAGCVELREDFVDYDGRLVLRHVMAGGHEDLPGPWTQHKPALLSFDTGALLLVGEGVPIVVGDDRHGDVADLVPVVPLAS